MRAPLLLLLTCLAGCQVPELERVDTRRDALPSLYGPPVSHFGASLADCPGAGYIVGAPGISAVVSTNSSTGLPTYVSIANGVGDAVACQRLVDGGLVAFAGGDGGAFQLLRDGGAELVRQFAAPVVALDHDGERLVIGAPPFVALGDLIDLRTDAGSRFGASLLRVPGYVLVGDPETSTVTVFSLDGGFKSRLDPALPGSQFGAALAWGVVSFGVDEQLLVGAPGTQRVFLFSLVNGVATASGAIPSSGAAGPAGFGSSIALAPLSVSNGESFNSVWVGAPEDDSVSQYVNGVEVQYVQLPELGSRFGAALSASALSAAVGSPEFDGGSGAIFFVDSEISRPGELRACTRGEACPINCRVGTCLGDAVCIEPVCSSSDCGCQVGFVCNQTTQECEAFDAGGVDAGFDAGTPDAGEEDAGFDAGTLDAGEEDAGFDAGTPDSGHEEDAGTPDAGQADAGAPDAGGDDAGAPDAGDTDGGVAPPVTFTTCGCTSGPALTFFWLGALLWRRRVTGR